MSTSWIEFDEDSDFSLQNIPFGIISTVDNTVPRPATIVGNTVVDLKAFAEIGGFDNIEVDKSVFEQRTLNAFAALGQPSHRLVREYLQQVFTANGKYSHVLEKHKNRAQVLLNISNVQNHLPMDIGDYTDFYVGLNHAYNCGILFRGPDNALQPNYYHMPVGYHGRASSVVVSGTNIHRPTGQIWDNPAAPTKTLLSPSKRLDYELEFAAFVCKPNELGSRIDVNRASEHIFGYVLMNDLSARDLQKCEAVPLGPATSKSFGTVVSPWVILHDAIATEPYRAAPLPRPDDKPLLDYLQEREKHSVFDMDLQVEITTPDGDTGIVSNVSSKNLLFSFPQMLAHHTVNGCNMRVGDLIASGTISGTGPGTYGSLFEASQNGKQEVNVASSKRKFLEDGDKVTMRGSAGQRGRKIGFGAVTTTALPARQ